MSVDLRKRIVDLRQKAAFAANKHGIEGQRAQVVLDISASMLLKNTRAGLPYYSVPNRCVELIVNWGDSGLSGRSTNQVGALY